MATLKYARASMLPPPKQPARGKLQDTTEALQRLGFNSAFDLTLEYEADLIQAKEISMSQRFEKAKAFAQSRRDTLALPFAYVQLQKPVRDDAYPLCDDTPKVLASAIARAASERHHVRQADVTVKHIEGKLVCKVASSTSTSVLGVRDILLEATHDRGGGLERGDPSGIHSAFYEAGAPADLSVEITTHFAWDRVVAQLKRWSPSVQEDELHSVLDDMQNTVMAAIRTFDDAWHEATLVERLDAAQLLSTASLARFNGKLWPSEKKRSSGEQSDEWAQDARNMPDLMQDALAMHSFMKATLAPDTEWSIADLNDIRSTPLDDECRRWLASSFNLAPNAVYFDPGVKSERHCFGKAKAKQRPEELEPPVHDLIPSRLVIIFKSIKDLNIALSKILFMSLDVVWMENRFASPTVLGYRYIDIGIRSKIGARSHIAALRLHLETLHSLREGTGAQCYKALQSSIGRLGLQGKELDETLRQTIRALGYMRWLQMHDKGSELLQAVAVVSSKEAGNLPSAQSFLVEMASQALAAGNSMEWVSQALDDMFSKLADLLERRKPSKARK